MSTSANNKKINSVAEFCIYFDNLLTSQKFYMNWPGCISIAKYRWSNCTTHLIFINLEKGFLGLLFECTFIKLYHLIVRILLKYFRKQQTFNCGDDSGIFPKWMNNFPWQLRFELRRMYRVVRSIWDFDLIFSPSGSQCLPICPICSCVNVFIHFGRSHIVKIKKSLIIFRNFYQGGR